VYVTKFIGALHALAHKVIVIIFGDREALLHSTTFDRLLITDANFPFLGEVRHRFQFSLANIVPGTTTELN